MNLRLKLCPQLKDYDQIGVESHPYVMFISTTNYLSNTLNTDRFGFRKTIFKDLSYSVENLHQIENCSLIIGGSTVFGVGSSSDGTTIPSLMSKEKNSLYLNFGGRAYNSTQELINFTRHISSLPPIKNVILFSGLNNFFLSRWFEPIYQPFFFSHTFREAMQYSLLSKKRKFLKALLNPIYGTKIDYVNISTNQLLKLILGLSEEYSPTQNSMYFDPLKAINYISQDLNLWKCFSTSLGFKLNYVLQPFPSWGQKPLSKEEYELFEFLDEQNGTLGDLKLLGSEENYKIYQQGIKEVCNNLSIPFYDSNTILREHSEWLFVDRAHLTDLGNKIITQDLLAVI